MQIGYFLPDIEPDEYDNSILKWLDSLDEYSVSTVKFSSDIDLKTLLESRAVWIDIRDQKVLDEVKDNGEFLSVIRNYYVSGGNLFFSNFAAYLPNLLGIETNKPELRIQDVIESGYGRKYGFQSFRGHSVFKGLFGGAYIIDKEEDTIEKRIGFFDDDLPKEGKVVGVEKAYVRLNHHNKVLIEYNYKKSKIICAGAFIDLKTQNLQERSQKILLKNIFDYLTGGKIDEQTYWGRPFEKAHPFEADDYEFPVPGKRHVNTDHNSGLLLTRDEAEDYFFDLAGRKCMLVAKETGGVHEVWTHPFRIIRNLECGVAAGGNVLWLNNLESSVEIRPESVKRTYNLNGHKLEETIFLPMDKAGGVIQFYTDCPEELEIIIRFNTDFRYMWPYDGGALGDLYTSVDKSRIHIRDSSGDFYAVFGLSDTPADIESGQYSEIKYGNDGLLTAEGDDNHVTSGFLFSLNKDNDNLINFVFTGTNNGKNDALVNYSGLMKDTAEEYSNTVDHYKDLLDNRTLIISPDSNFNDGYKWALIGADRFFAVTPGVGGGLLAGIGNSESGWDGGHETSGRPGYAWYFGRDACWSGFAVNNYGDFEIIKEQLELFRKYQGATGKIFHELSTSGVVHYDAADATPMYVMLAAQYLRSSGDIEFISEIRESIKDAMDYMYTTDFNNDGLIDNFRVGHGWIEGGPMYPPRTTLYLAGLWAQALKDASYIADVLEQDVPAEKYQTDHLKVKDLIEDRFWNKETEFYSFSLKADGTFEKEKSIMPAVLMDLKLLDPVRTENILNEFAGSKFSTDWGTRIVGNNSKHYNPVSYHSGSVWPLYTGWTALAEYNYGRSVSAYTHIMSNLNVYKDWTLGFVEEVLHGDNYMKHGVCPHQCWSETNILYPLISGMVGFEPDAPNKKAALSPRFPVNWESVEVRNLYAGRSRINFKKIVEKGRTDYEFELVDGNEIAVGFTPEIMPGTIIEDLKVNGNSIEKRFLGGNDGLPDSTVEFRLSGKANISIFHKYGIGTIPVEYYPAPGDKTKEIKIINSELIDDEFIIDVECCREGENVIEIISHDTEIEDVSGANIISKEMDKLKLHIEADSNGYSKKQVKIKLKYR
ncbi:amylo-alpha-1,6-glucosidase [candidate division KSB1 bacterium]